MNAHDRARFLASSAMDFALSDSEQSELTEHLATCTTCADARTGYRSQLALATAAPAAAATPRLRLRLNEALAGPVVAMPQVRTARLPVGLVFALLLLAAGLAVVSTIGHQQVTPPVPAGPPAFGVVERTIPVDSGWTGRICAAIPETGCVDGIADAFGSVWATARSRVVRIDPATDKVLARIPVGTAPYTMVDGAGSLWVAIYSDGTVVRISPEKNTVIATVRVGGEPTDLAFGFGSVWSVENRTHVDRIDPATDRVIATIALAEDPSVSVSNRAISVEVGGSGVWVATQGSRNGTIWRIDPATNRAESWVDLPDSADAHGAAIQPGGDGQEMLWVQHHGSYSEVSTSDRVIARTIPSWCGDWIPDGATFVAACNEPHEIHRVDPSNGDILAATKITLLPDPLGHNQWETSIAAGDGAFWVRSYDNDAVLRIEPSAR